MKKNKLILCIFISLIFVSCFKPDWMAFRPSFVAAVKFVDSNGKRIQSPYKKVYERTVLTNIDSISVNSGRYMDSVNYVIPFPTIENPKPLFIIFEKPSGQKDSIAIDYSISRNYGGRRDGMEIIYQNISTIFPKTSFPSNNIKLKYSAGYVFEITL